MDKKKYTRNINSINKLNGRHHNSHRIIQEQEQEEEVEVKTEIVTMRFIAIFVGNHKKR